MDEGDDLTCTFTDNGFGLIRRLGDSFRSGGKFAGLFFCPAFLDLGSQAKDAFVFESIKE